MEQYPWWTKYVDAIQADQPNQFACIDAAVSEIYNRLEDYLQGRQHLDSGEWSAIKKALHSLRGLRHDIAA
jgi:hypothetical protein